MSDFDSPPPPTVTPPPTASQGLIARIQAILTKPEPTWDVIAAEPASVNSLYMGYVVPLAAIGPIANAIGGVVFGHGMFGISYHTPIIAAVVGGVVAYVLSLIMIYVVALVIDGLAPSFDGQKNFLAALKVAVYASTAGWVGAILGILPALAIIGGLFGLYGIYLMYLGLPKLMKSPKEKTVVYMIVIAVIVFVLGIVVGAVTTAVSGMAFLGGSALNGGLGHVNAPGNITLSGPNGKVNIDTNQMAAAANQMAAQASAMQNAANGTGAPVKVADATALAALMPQSFMGASPTDTSTSSGGAAGISASTAEATYAVNGGTIRLKVSDIGTMAGLGGMAAAMNLNSSQSSAGGDEKITTANGQMATETWHSDSKSGEYTVVANGRVTVEAEGTNVDMGTIKALVSQVNIASAEALTK